MAAKKKPDTKDESLLFIVAPPFSPHFFLVMFVTQYWQRQKNVLLPFFGWGVGGRE